jgi:hypothetical protein
MDLLKLEPDSDSETCHDGSQVLDIKVEGVTDIQEEDPVQRTFPALKNEHEVGHVSVCALLDSFLRYLHLPLVSISIYLSIHMTQQSSSQ